MPVNTHSLKESPSSAYRWTKCPLAAIANSLQEFKETPASIYGTQTHALGEALIRKSLGLVDYDNENLSIDDLIKTLSMYDEQMQELAEGWASNFLSLIEVEKKATGETPFYTIEQGLQSDFDEELHGTLDAGIISKRNGGTLIIADMKTGRGPVMAYDESTKEVNSQLAIYALLFYQTYKDLYPIKNVRLVIYQPLIHNNNEYEMSVDDLLKFQKEVLLPAIEKIKENSHEANAGKWCKYCGFAATCLKRHEALNAGINTSISVENLTDSQIEDLLPKLDALIDYAISVKDYALEKALKGKKWGNYKLVRGKSTRVISNEDAVVKAIEDIGIDPYGPRKLMGITDLTKKLGKDKFNEIVVPYLTKKEGTLSLAPNDDPREEVQINQEEK